MNIKSLSIRNFMSVGNVTQIIPINANDLTLALGENLDQGDGARNGTGKTTIINALSYVLYGQALTNIRMDNLINRDNEKEMIVTLDFEKNDIEYRVERGRKPNILKLFIDNQEQSEEQGNNKDTQFEIERILNMKHDMFKHIIALNTYTQPFLQSSANDQRNIIEQLLGITLLSDKAESLKTEIKNSTNLITEEEYEIQSLQNTNTKLQKQIINLKNKQKTWHNDKETDIKKLNSALKDIEHIDIDMEIKNHQLLETINADKKEYQEALKWHDAIESEMNTTAKKYASLEQEIAILKESRCHSCNQILQDEKQKEMIDNKQFEMSNIIDNLQKNEKKLQEYKNIIEDPNKQEPPECPITFYKSLDDAYNHKSNSETLKKDIERQENAQDPYAEQILDMQKELTEIDYTKINKLNRIKEHQDFLLKLLTKKDSFIRKRIIERNLEFLNNRLAHYLQKLGLPHSVKFMNDLSVEINELGKSLDFGNLSRGERNRLILGLSWAFRDVWENLYQSINLVFIDEVMDSGMDNAGVESSLELLKFFARERNKNVWLVSHKDDLSSRFSNVLKVTKQNGFTEYSME